MTNQYEDLSLSVGRDYRTTTKYEFVLFNGEEVVARQGFFASAAQARRAGLKAADELLAPALI